MEKEGDVVKKIIEKINQEQMKKKLPNVRIGDTVKVQVKIVEGDKERLQAYSGTVIAKKGAGINASICVRRISFGEGVERVFLMHSPRIEKIEVTKIGDVRRAKLYYLRDRVGKHGKVAEKRRVEVEGEKEAAVVPAPVGEEKAESPVAATVSGAAVPEAPQKAQ